jgi:6-pyruvoyltetrahydropterin/6-carboxytetrahydropterin synthase
MDVKILADIIKGRGRNPFDHKKLNLDVPEFKNLNPTAENIVVVIGIKNQKRIKDEFDVEVVLMRLLQLCNL